MPVYYKNEVLRHNGTLLTEFLTLKNIASLKFELIEDEVDIDNIEELNDTFYDEENFTSEEKEYYHNLTREQQNKILRAVKQLNKQIKSIKEKNI